MEEPPIKHTHTEEIPWGQDFSRHTKYSHKCICLHTHTHTQNFLYRLKKIMNKKELLENYCKGDTTVGTE